MHKPKRIKVTDVNPFLICVLCGGYFVDATTIIECLHSFCRSCIVKYLEKNKYCPICDVQVHKHTPLLNVRTDKTLQTLVYKLVPSLYQNEMRRRREFWSNCETDNKLEENEEKGIPTESSSIILPEEKISICLEYQNQCNTKETVSSPLGKRYFHCPAVVTISTLMKLLRGKYSLSQDQAVHLYFKDNILPPSLSLTELAYIYQWKRKGYIHLTYRILEIKKKVIERNEKDEATNDKEVGMPDNNGDKAVSRLDEWKEVALAISENGVMSVVGMDDKNKNAQLSDTGDKILDTVSSLVRNSELEVVALDKMEANKQKIYQAKGEALNRIVSRLSPNERLIGNTSVSIRAVPSSPAPAEKVKTSVPPPPPPVTLTPSPSSVLSLLKESRGNGTIVVGNVIVSKETPTPKERDTIPRLSVSLTKEPPLPQSHHQSTSTTTLQLQQPMPAVAARSSSIVPHSTATSLSEITPATSLPQSVAHYSAPTQQPLPASRQLSSKQPFPIHSAMTKQHSSVQQHKPKVQTFKYKTLKYPSKSWNPTLDKSTMLSLKQSSPKPPPRFFKARSSESSSETSRFMDGNVAGLLSSGDSKSHQLVLSNRLDKTPPPPYTPTKRPPSSFLPPHPAHFPAMLFPFRLPTPPPHDLLRSMFPPGLLMPPLPPPPPPIPDKQFSSRTINNNVSHASSPSTPPPPRPKPPPAAPKPAVIS